MKIIKSTKFAILLVFILLLCGCSSPPKLRPLSYDAVVLAFGDSLTYGYGVSREKSYPAVLGKLIHRMVINSGVNGLDTSNALKMLPKLLDQYHPALVILCIGGNDMLRKMKAAQIQANIEKMVNMIQNRGIQMVLIAEPQPKLLASSPGFYKTIGKKYRIPVEMNLVTSLERQAKYKSDLIHLNEQGYEKLAEGIANLLKRAGAI